MYRCMLKGLGDKRIYINADAAHTELSKQDSDLLKVCFVSDLQVKVITVFALVWLHAGSVVLLQELQSSNGTLSSPFHIFTFFVYDWVALASDVPDS